MPDGALVVIVVVLAGWLVAGMVWDRGQRRARDLDQLEHHRSLMREIRRHDGSRR